MFCLSIFSASQRSALMRFLKVPAEICSACQRLHQVLDVLRSQSLRPKMPEAAVGQLVGHQAQDALAVVLRLERAIAVALAQLLEVVIEVAHRVASFLDPLVVQSKIRVWCEAFR